MWVDQKTEKLLGDKRKSEDMASSLAENKGEPDHNVQGTAAPAVAQAVPAPQVTVLAIEDAPATTAVDIVVDQPVHLANRK